MDKRIDLVLGKQQFEKFEISFQYQNRRVWEVVDETKSQHPT